jgi:hypothetical protein
MGDCSLPRLFGIKQWFDDRFQDCCAWHDERYVARDCWKIHADYGVSIRIAMKGMRYFPLGVASFVMLTINPIAYRMWLTD